MNLSESISGNTETVKDSKTPDLSIFDNTRRITRAFDIAVREALLDHKRAGNSVAIWRDGKVVIVPPEEIDIDSSETDTPEPQTQTDQKTA